MKYKGSCLIFRGKGGVPYSSNDKGTEYTFEDISVNVNEKLSEVLVDHFEKQLGTDIVIRDIHIDQKY